MSHSRLSSRIGFVVWNACLLQSVHVFLYTHLMSHPQTSTPDDPVSDKTDLGEAGGAESS